MGATRTGAGHGRPARLLVVAIVMMLTGACAGAAPTRDQDRPLDDAVAALADLERGADTRVGVVAIDLADGRSITHRADERFGFASTLKVFAAAALLDATDAEDLAQTVTWTRDDVVAAGYAPVTGAAVQEGLPLGALAEAAVRDSDNLAMNLVLERLGGPAALGEALQAAGDAQTEVVDVEPDLNTVTPDDAANTTTPRALAEGLRRLVAGDWLDDADRDQLLTWMTGNATGDALVRAGAPDGWKVLDKSGGAGTLRNDVAVVRPPGREPIVLAVLTERTDPEDDGDAVVASAARVVLSALA